MIDYSLSRADLEQLLGTLVLLTILFVIVYIMLAYWRKRSTKRVHFLPILTLICSLWLAQVGASVIVWFLTIVIALGFDKLLTRSKLTTASKRMEANELTDDRHDPGVY
jgi:uncharacterized membrane protein